MFPKVGDHVKINPEWVRRYDNGDISSTSSFGLMKSAGLVGEELVVKDVSNGEGEVVVKGDFRVFLNQDGTYMGRSNDGISFFVTTDMEKSVATSHCPMCGSNGWEGFNMFHCQNPSCINSR